MENAIEIRDLTKSFRNKVTREDILAVDHLNLDVQKGEIFGFLGPNGAGKTTTIKMLLGLIFPTAGTASILGYPPGEILAKKQISYLPESPYFYEHMTGFEVLDFYGTLFGIPTGERHKRVEELLTQVGLAKARNKKLRHYSKGMLQRVGLAQALINDPKVLFLDEPTSGLDPIAHQEIRELIVRLREEGRTVFLSSHQLSDVEMICDRVSILNHGKLLRVGSMKDLLAQQTTHIVASDVTETAHKQIQEYIPDAELVSGLLTARTDQGHATSVAQIIIQNGGSIIQITPIQKTLEEIFMETIREGQAS